VDVYFVSCLLQLPAIRKGTCLRTHVSPETHRYLPLQSLSPANNHLDCVFVTRFRFGCRLISESV